MRVKAYCAHLSVRDHWTLRGMSTCSDQVVSLKRNHHCLSPQANLVFIYRPTVGGMKGRVDFAQPEDRAWSLRCEGASVEDLVCVLSAKLEFSVHICKLPNLSGGHLKMSWRSTGRSRST
ncbi:hypothetical protein TNCV_1955251 [Trichonephila clavipes]|nr:hypothetical protein TNCV_1955251 [Trichonephila clavipes]